jgi:hypothetical protein
MATMMKTPKREWHDYIPGISERTDVRQAALRLQTESALFPGMSGTFEKGKEINIHAICRRGSLMAISGHTSAWRLRLSFSLF